MTHRLLVLDDEPLIAWGIADEMEELGWDVPHILGTRAAALEAIGAGGVEAAIIDFNLRGETSEDVARMLIERAIPFVFVSGAIPAHFPNFGVAIEILQKPIDFERVSALLESYLGQSGTAGLARTDIGAADNAGAG